MRWFLLILVLLYLALLVAVARGADLHLGQFLGCLLLLSTLLITTTLALLRRHFPEAT